MTLEELESIVEELVDLRRAELSQIMRVVGSHKETTLEITASVMAIPVLYAHWEGFVKEVLVLYLDYIESQAVEPPNLHPHLFSFSMKRQIKTLIASGSVDKCSEFASWMIDQVSGPVAFEDKKIETNSNLSYDNLKALCHALFIDVAGIAENRRRIDALVHKRNNIAHTGRPLRVSEGDVESDRELVLRLIENFAALVLGCVRTQSFRLAAA